jgi:7,8-dihydro-6-hydroxymethylpterin-pyrophosphokinase
MVYQENFLIIPHPQMHLRNFVLKPLQDIAGAWVHPLLHKDVNTLYSELKDSDKTMLNTLDGESILSK